MKHSEKNARADGYIDGLENRSGRAHLYSPESYATAYRSGYDDGVASRNRQRHKLRGLADYAFGVQPFQKEMLDAVKRGDDIGQKPLRGSTAEEARNPNFYDAVAAETGMDRDDVKRGIYAGTVTGRWSGRRLTAFHPAFGAPYGGFRRVMIAGDIAAGTDAMEDLPCNGWLWVSVYERMAAALKPREVSEDYARRMVDDYRQRYGRYMDEIFPLDPPDISPDIGDAIRYAMEGVPQWTGLDLGREVPPCSKCGGDCSAANPPVTDCPLDRYRKD